MSVRIRPVNGGDKALDAFLQALKTAPETLKDMSRQMAEETVGLIKDQHRSETDPYGSRWAPKKKKDGRKVLSGKTSRLKGGWHVVKSGKGGFTVAPSVNYATFHQTGTRHMEKRLLVPDGGLPRKWQDVFAEIVEETLDAHFAEGMKGGGVSWLQHKMIGLKRRISPSALLRKVAKAIAE